MPSAQSSSGSDHERGLVGRGRELHRLEPRRDCADEEDVEAAGDGVPGKRVKIVGADPAGGALEHDVRNLAERETHVRLAAQTRD